MITTSLQSALTIGDCSFADVTIPSPQKISQQQQLVIFAEKQFAEIKPRKNKHDDVTSGARKAKLAEQVKQKLEE